MAIDYRHGISIFEIVVYSPTLFLALWMAINHGFKRSSGWFFFIVFCLARIVGSACYLATINSPSTTGLYIAWAVCTSLGISPLILACIGLLSRANESIMRKTANHLPPIRFRLVGVVAIVAVILNITGVTASSDITHGLVSTQTKFGLILYLVAWVGVCGLFFLISQRTHCIEDGEHRLLLAVGVSLPLILVRLIYSLIYTFGQKKAFNMLVGNVTIQLVMSVLEEMVVVLVCLGIGLTLQIRPPAEYTQQPSVSSRQEDLVELGSGRLMGQRREK
ncbi:uncharacterized protein N7500_005708 [Penicillium coprophilum]|uniref:uncharacterized protein n=1 Tax=Penicillium coprophilum TaxID=36646 RepID=UPI00239F4C8E|nr:uncharacterized protein N7500_005708 [Penicillium coprophilum]KAJ5163878.1 hypothetical protein N7500_005708 [Penicillium coprophilum]